MIKLRKKHDALRHGRFSFLKAETGDHCIIYERINDTFHFTIWINNTDQTITLSHPMQTNDWCDALSEEQVLSEPNELNVALEPYGYRILYRKL
jgi:hypothetical protein